MGPNPIVIIGCGGFGREVFEIINRTREQVSDYEVVGFLDDQPSAYNLSRVESLSTRHLGSTEDYSRVGVENVVVSIGDPSARRGIVTKLSGWGARFPALVDPAASVGREVTLGPGSVVCPGARLSTGIQVGSHVHVDQNATVGHDSVISDFARINPQACISGNVSIHAEALVGAHATVLAGLEIGAQAVVGAGAVVVRSVSKRTVVKGVPAR